jgi:hypothetical protein
MLNDKLHSDLHWYMLMLDIFFCLEFKKQNNVKKKKEKMVSVIYLWKAKYDGSFHQQTKLIVLQS